MASPPVPDGVLEISYRDVLAAHPQLSPELADQYAHREAAIFALAASRPAGWSWAQFDESCAELDRWLETQLAAEQYGQPPA